MIQLIKFNQVFSILMVVLIGCSHSELKQKEERYPSGNIKIQAESKDGVLNGDFIEYFDGGKVKRLLKYSNGVLHGKAIDYYPNEIIKRKYNYTKGKLDGVVKVYFSDGTLNKVFKYKDGNIHGDLVEYTNDGRKYSITTYIDGKKKRYIVFHPNGKIFLDEDRNDDERHGIYKVYFEDGKTLDEIGFYNLGERDGWFVRYYKSGQVKDSVFFDKGRWKIAHHFDSLSRKKKTKENLN